MPQTSSTKPVDTASVGHTAIKDPLPSAQQRPIDPPVRSYDPSQVNSFFAEAGEAQSSRKPSLASVDGRRIDGVDERPLLSDEQVLNARAAEDSDTREGSYQPPAISPFAEAGRSTFQPNRFVQSQKQRPNPQPGSRETLGSTVASSAEHSKPSGKIDPPATSEASPSKTSHTPRETQRSTKAANGVQDITNVQALEKLATSLTGLTREDLAKRLPIKEAVAFERAFSRIIDVGKEFFAEIADTADGAGTSNSQPVPQGSANPFEAQADASRPAKSGETTNTSGASSGEADSKNPSLEKSEMIEQLLEALIGMPKDELEDLLKTRQIKSMMKSIVRLMEMSNEFLEQIGNMK